MDGLIQLAQLVNRQKAKQIEVIGKKKVNPSKLDEFYFGIIEGKLTSDQEAASFLYQSKPSSHAYKKLKNRLQDRLINSVFFIDVNKPSYTDYDKAYYNAQKGLAACNVLFGKFARNAAIELAEKIIRIAVKYEFSEIIINLCLKLSRHFGSSLQGNLKKYVYYRELHLQYFEIFSAEVLAEGYFNELRMHYTNSTATQLNIADKAEKYALNLEEYKGKVITTRFLLFSNLVFSQEHESRNDYGKLLTVCQEATKQLMSKENFRKNAVYLFLSKMLICHFKLKQFDEGILAYKKSLKLISKYSLNWFNLNDSYFKLALHSNKYQEAYKILLIVKSNQSLNTKYNNIKETWRINEAYVNFFTIIGKIQRSETDTVSGKFRINKFLNEVPVFSADKRGHNIPILIIQILFLLQQKKYGKVIDKVEALNAYCYRYLKKDDTFRSNCFIKMLLLLPKCNFHRIAVERKSKTLLGKLNSVPLEIARQSADIEIVPYEDLWEIVMDMLENKFYRKKGS